IPLLKLASEVRVMRAGKVAADDDLAEPSNYLSRYGIPAEIRLVDDPGRSVVELIRKEVARWGADWGVMGAYGHSRMREAVVGGVAGQMLTESDIPLVLGH